MPGAAGRTLLLTVNDRRAAQSALSAAGLGWVKTYKRSPQRELARAFGERLGSLKPIYRVSLANPITRSALRQHGEALNANEARRTIDDAVRANNAMRGSGMPAFDIVPG